MIELLIPLDTINPGEFPMTELQMKQKRLHVFILINSVQTECFCQYLVKNKTRQY